MSASIRHRLQEVRPFRSVRTPAEEDTEDGNTEKPQRLANALAVEVVLHSVAEDDESAVTEHFLTADS